MSGLGGANGQFAYFIRDHCKAPTGLTRSGGFYRRVEGEQVGLVGDALDGGDDMGQLAEVLLHGGVLERLGLVQLTLFVAGMNVGDRADHAQGRAIGGAPGLTTATKPAVLARLVAQAISYIERRLAAVIVDVGDEGINSELAVFGMQARRLGLQRVGKFLEGGMPQQATHLRRPPDGIFRIGWIARDDLDIP